MSDVREEGPTAAGRWLLLGLLGLGACWLILGLATYGAVQLARSWGWL